MGKRPGSGGGIYRIPSADGTFITGGYNGSNRGSDNYPGYPNYPSSARLGMTITPTPAAAR